MFIIVFVYVNICEDGLYLRIRHEEERRIDEVRILEIAIANTAANTEKMYPLRSARHYLDITPSKRVEISRVVNLLMEHLGVVYEEENTADKIVKIKKEEK
jgi:hypothetical protein